MEDFSTLLDLGRSKGVCVVLAAQDTSQIRIRYGQDRTNAWLSMFGTHVVCRMSVGEGAEDISRALGAAEVEETQRSSGYTGGRYSSSTSMQRRTTPVMTPPEIASELGPGSKSVRVLIVGVGPDYHLVELPILAHRKWREAHDPAGWTLKNAPPEAEPGFIPEPPAGLISKVDLEAIKGLKSSDRH